MIHSSDAVRHRSVEPSSGSSVTLMPQTGAAILRTTTGEFLKGYSSQGYFRVLTYMCILYWLCLVTVHKDR